MLVLIPSPVTRLLGDISHCGSVLWSALGKRVSNGAVTPCGAGSVGHTGLCWSHCQGVCRFLSEEPVSSHAPPAHLSPGLSPNNCLLFWCCVTATCGIPEPSVCQPPHWPRAVEAEAAHPSNSGRSLRLILCPEGNLVPSQGDLSRDTGFKHFPQPLLPFSHYSKIKGAPQTWEVKGLY